MSSQRVLSVGELPEGGAVRVIVDGVPVAVVRDEEGHVHAIDDTCTHAEVSLSEGEVEDCTIECWLHGSRSGLRPAQPTALPAIRPVAVYPVTIDGNDIFVDTHVPANAGE